MLKAVCMHVKTLSSEPCMCELPSILLFVHRQVLAAFDNGRIEEFLNMRTLEPKDMTARPMAARIARRLKQFHAVDIAGPREPQSFRSIRKW